MPALDKPHLRTKCCWLPWMASSSSRSYASGITASWYRCCRTAGQRFNTAFGASAGEERRLSVLTARCLGPQQCDLLLFNKEKGLVQLRTR